ncbi:MAG: dihydropteroate synthase [candidate division NC10 bacterium]|nr:dihydropteroate synthase [candidate division NC10 bacterium]
MSSSPGHPPETWAPPGDRLPLLRCRRFSLDVSARTRIMGVLNVTPDSFSDGGRYLDPGRAVEHAHQMVEEGADLIDVGGESTRPGSLPVSAEEELRRILPPLRHLVDKLPVPVSVDTTKADVAAAVLAEGADLINDISGLGFDPRVASVVAGAGAGLILGHIRGTPRTMQQDLRYTDLLVDVREYLKERILLAETAGVHPEAIMVDPGIGFGKSVEHNLLLLKCLPALHGLKKPILVGPSRKSFIGKVLDLPVEERGEGTAAAVAVAIWQGAHIVRVHDVRSMVRVARMTQAIREAGALSTCRGVLEHESIDIGER